MEEQKKFVGSFLSATWILIFSHFFFLLFLLILLIDFHVANGENHLIVPCVPVGTCTFLHFFESFNCASKCIGVCIMYGVMWFL